MKVDGKQPGLQTSTGYLHDLYAESLAFAGQPVRLERSGGVLVERDIPGTHLTDLMGSYPIFCCRDWTKLEEDLEALGDRAVALTLVTDPFGEYRLDQLHASFPDVCRPYKEHAVVDLGQEASSFVSSHHRRNVKKALKLVDVEVCTRPQEHLEEWNKLYGCLVARHQIRGVPTFSPPAFRRQLQVPGLVMLRAACEGKTVGMILWYVQGDVGYYHLAAYTEQGYRARASFALFWRSLEILAGRVRWLSLGANAGAAQGADGLSRFKAGWATGTRMTWLCGRIMNPGQYEAIAAETGASGGSPAFFPVYRQPSDERINAES